MHVHFSVLLMTENRWLFDNPLLLFFRFRGSITLRAVDLDPWRTDELSVQAVTQLKHFGYLMILSGVRRFNCAYRGVLFGVEYGARGIDRGDAVVSEDLHELRVDMLDAPPP